MDKAILGQLDLVFTGNQGKTDQRGIDLFKKEEAACPFLPELFQTYLLFLGSWGIRGRYTRNKQAELAAALNISAEDIRKRGEALHENNPMMGHRGVRLGVTYPEVTEMQVRAIFESAAELLAETLAGFDRAKLLRVIDTMRGRRGPLREIINAPESILSPLAGPPRQDTPRKNKLAP